MFVFLSMDKWIEVQSHSRKGGVVGNPYVYGVVGNCVENVLESSGKDAFSFSTGFQCVIHAVINNGMRVIHKSTLKEDTDKKRMPGFARSGRSESRRAKPGIPEGAALRRNPRIVTRG